MKFDDITGNWDYGSLPSNIQIGSHCFLERKDSFSRFRSRQKPGLVLGDRVRVCIWSSFSIEPSGFVEIGSDSLLVGAVFMCAERITIGRGVVISYGVTLADCDFHPTDPDLRRVDAIANAPFGDHSARPSLVSRPLVIDDGAWIGAGAIILKGVRVGRGARVGAGAVVTRDVADGTCVAGNPARVVPAEEVP